ncbi:MAG: glycosyltransferase [Deltaproteobacteria bacterium]|nr:glycosyltransferase [Deltaproteobacteria bacterium]
MPFPDKALKNICGCLYLALGNKYIDQLFWKSVESKSACMQDAVCCLRKYQADLLNLLSKRIDERELFHLSATLKSFLFFRRNKNNTGLSQPTENFAVQRSNSDISYDFCSHSYPSGKSAKASQERYPAISIVTPNYNQGKFLEKCIQSILSQDYPDLELIIIDGGSTDESVEIIKKYENQLTFWVSEKDEGQADAINKGLRHVTGEIFNWINSDDYLEPGALFKCADAYKENPSAAGWIGGCRRIDSNGMVLNVIYPNGFDRENIGQNWYGTQFYQPACFLSTKIVKELNGLDKNLYIALDLDLWIRVLEKGNFFAGKGIWSNAVIHAQAKTQEREKVLLETSEVQRKYGFIEGAEIRRKVAFRKGFFQYVPPIRLKDGLECIEVVPDCYAISNMKLPFRKRKHICFIGSHDVNRDIEAVRNFVDNIFIHILRKNPTIEFHVIGDNLKCFKEEFPVQTNVKMVNCRGNQENLLPNYRLCVFPDTRQTWLNDGVGIAAGAGIPIVTSPAAAQGYPVNDGQECFIADSPQEFGEKCNQCLRELITWHNFRVRSQLMIAENYSPKFVAEKLAGVLLKNGCDQ